MSAADDRFERPQAWRAEAPARILLVSCLGALSFAALGLLTAICLFFKYCEHTEFRLQGPEKSLQHRLERSNRQPHQGNYLLDSPTVHSYYFAGRMVRLFARLAALPA